VRVLVTGATGLLGGAIRQRLLSRNHVVVAMGRTPIGDDFVPTDLRDPSQVREATHKADWIVHAAGKTGELNGDQSTVAMAAAVAAGARDCRVMNLSSVAVYGNIRERVVTEAESCRPVSEYGISKLAAETAIDRQSTQSSHLRIGNVYGSGTSLTDLGGPFKRILRANEVLNLVLVQDVADLVAHLIERNDSPPHKLNVVRPELGNVRIRELVGPVGPLAVPDRFVPPQASHLLRRLRGVASLPNKSFCSAHIASTNFRYRPLEEVAPDLLARLHSI